MIDTLDTMALTTDPRRWGQPIAHKKATQNGHTENEWKVSRDRGEFKFFDDQRVLSYTWLQQ